MTEKHERAREFNELKKEEGRKKTKPDNQSQNVNHNTKKVSLGPNTKR